jgi:hypothetical protein
MTANMDRLKNDLDTLIKQGDLLDLAMSRIILGSSKFRAQVVSAVGERAADEYINRLPDFKLEYEAWYSESLVLLKQLLPHRVNDFVGRYEKPKGRKSIRYENYVMQDFLQDLRVTYGGEVMADRSAAEPQYRQQLAILKAARTRFKSSLFEIRQLVQADLFDSEIDAARELLKNKFLRAAGAVAGVVLEKHLHQVYEDHGIKIAKKTSRNWRSK